METEKTTQCLCNSVNVSYKGDHKKLGVCHCSMCRKWSGSPFIGVECDEITFSPSEQVGVYASSEWAERGFCRQCGTHLFYRFKQNNQYIVPVGLLNPDPEHHLDHQIFIDEKPDYYSFANKTEMMTGQQVMDMFKQD